MRIKWGDACTEFSAVDSKWLNILLAVLSLLVSSLVSFSALPSISESKNYSCHVFRWTVAFKQMSDIHLLPQRIPNSPCNPNLCLVHTIFKGSWNIGSLALWTTQSWVSDLAAFPPEHRDEWHSLSSIFFFNQVYAIAQLSEILWNYGKSP